MFIILFMDLDIKQIRELDKSNELIVVDGIKIINDMKTNYFNTIFNDIQQKLKIGTGPEIRNEKLVEFCNVPVQVHYDYGQRNKPRHRFESSQCTWTKITTTNKYKLVNIFIESLNINDKRLKANVLYLLTSAIDLHKITKNIDVDYDIASKTLKGIYKLYVDTTTGEYKISENNLLTDYVRIIE